MQMRSRAGFRYVFIVAALAVMNVSLPASEEAAVRAAEPQQVRHLPGQIVPAPGKGAWLAYNRDADRDGRLDPFFMCGPGGPEGFLFGDIVAGDTPDTVLDKMIEHGGNCLYMMGIRSHGGDGKPTHNPFIDHDPAKGLDPKVLDRWEQWFQRMEAHGIVIYFFLFDDSVRIWKGDEIAPAERRYLRGIVDRFEHHPNLIWCVAEEYSEALSPTKVRKAAAEIRDADDHDHVIATHQHGGQTLFDFADDADQEQFAMQIGGTSPADVHAACLEAWHRARGRYNVVMSELLHHGELLTAGDRDGVRKVIWAAAVAGNYVMHLGTWETDRNR